MSEIPFKVGSRNGVPFIVKLEGAELLAPFVAAAAANVAAAQDLVDGIPALVAAEAGPFVEAAQGAATEAGETLTETQEVATEFAAQYTDTERPDVGLMLVREGGLGFVLDPEGRPIGGAATGALAAASLPWHSDRVLADLISIGRWRGKYAIGEAYVARDVVFDRGQYYFVRSAVTASTIAPAEPNFYVVPLEGDNLLTTVDDDFTTNLGPLNSRPSPPYNIPWSAGGTGVVVAGYATANANNYFVMQGLPATIATIRSRQRTTTGSSQLYTISISPGPVMDFNNMFHINSATSIVGAFNVWPPIAGSTVYTPEILNYNAGLHPYLATMNVDHETIVELRGKFVFGYLMIEGIERLAFAAAGERIGELCATAQAFYIQNHLTTLGVEQVRRIRVTTRQAPLVTNTFTRNFLSTASTSALARGLLGAAPSLMLKLTTSGTFVKANYPGLVGILVRAIGGGGGGASGRRGAAGTIRSGGGGGGGGGDSGSHFIPEALLPASISYAIGAGGLGGVAAATDDTNGTNGSAGGTTNFGSAGAYMGFMGALGGAGGAGGGVAATVAAVGGVSTWAGGAGGISSVSGAAPASPRPGAMAPTGGGAGGSITAANALLSGGYAANNGLGVLNQWSWGGSPATSTADVTPPLDHAPGDPRGGAGGSGGYPDGSTHANGAKGATFGGGGGGGAASVNGTVSGAGGDGAPGAIDLILIFGAGS
jgi:hypothetical protein